MLETLISGSGRPERGVTPAAFSTRWMNGSTCSICICVSTESGWAWERIEESGLSEFWVLMVSGAASTFSLAVAR